MTARVPLPYGSWPSPISAADVARGRLHLGFPTVLGDEVWWQESRPQEGGRTTVVHYRGGRMTELLPAPWDARTRVHEYGGRSYLPVPAPGGHALIFTNFADQRMYLLAPGDRPRPLTPEPAKPGGLRYADFVLSPDGKEVWCVCEGHTPGGVRRAIVAVPLDGRAAENAGAIRELVGGADFYAFPTPSPEGGYLAWVQWNHPRMPWDGAEVRVAALQDGRTASPRTVKGGMTESALAPLWCGERSLYVISDWPGWWNIYQVGVYGESPQALYPAEEEFAAPPWRLGGAPYAMLADGRLAVLHGEGDQRLGVYDPETLELTDLDLPYTDWRPALSADGTTIVGIAGSPTRPGTVVRVDAATGRCEALRHELTHPPDAALLPRPRAGKLEGPFGRPVHALIHPPANPQAQAPDGELPPYVVFVHGGPTSRASSTLDLERAYFTSRGIGVIDVDYGGSCGHGRAYRERLRRQWGVVDVQDCAKVARGLVERGVADASRIAIRGGSAGGWTTVAALVHSDVFAGGVAHYAITDPESWAAETHDFESRYLDGLVGPLPETRQRYTERSPLLNAFRASGPCLMLHGLEDAIVDVSQAQRFTAELDKHGKEWALLTFPGEQHGWRREETIVAVLEAELAFYGLIFDMETPDVPPLTLKGRA